jgi:CRP/FNR family transcriptional regulator
MNTTADYLKQVKLFADLSDSQREHLAAACIRKVWRAHRHLFHQGDDGKQLYIVMRGGVKIYHDAESTGQETILALLTEGDFFGEMALLTGGERTASAVTIAEETELLRLDQTNFYSLLHDSPELAVALLRNLALRLKQTNESLVAIASDSSLARVTKLLLARADVASGMLCPPLSQQEIANLIGTRRETVARNLARLERIGVLKRNRGRIVIINRAGLERVASAS